MGSNCLFARLLMGTGPTRGPLLAKRWLSMPVCVSGGVGISRQGPCAPTGLACVTTRARWLELCAVAARLFVSRWGHLHSRAKLCRLLLRAKDGRFLPRCSWACGGSLSSLAGVHTRLLLSPCWSRLTDGPTLSHHLLPQTVGQGKTRVGLLGAWRRAN